MKYITDWPFQISHSQEQPSPIKNSAHSAFRRAMMSNFHIIYKTNGLNGLECKFGLTLILTAKFANRVSDVNWTYLIIWCIWANLSCICILFKCFKLFFTLCHSWNILKYSWIILRDIGDMRSSLSKHSLSIKELSQASQLIRSCAQRVALSFTLGCLHYDRHRRSASIDLWGSMDRCSVPILRTNDQCPHCE